VDVSFKGSKMEDEKKTKRRLIEELAGFRDRISEFRKIEKEYKRAAGALAESEKRYRTLFENAPVGIAISTVEGNILACNEMLQNITGYSESEMKEKNVADTYVDIADRNEIFDRIRVDGYVRDFEVKFKRKDGSFYWALLDIIPHAYNGDKVFLTIKRDITEKKRADSEIQKTARLESLATLVGGIAHDFNNILTLILGNISFSKNNIGSFDEDTLTGLLTEAEAASLRAKDLTKQLLTFAKGTLYKRKVTDVSKVVKETASFALSGSNVLYEFELADDMWLAEVNESRVGQVINNVVINAIQAMPDGGVVRISGENVVLGKSEIENNPQLEVGKYIKISIEDQGVGIAEEHIGSIFDPFFTTKKKGNGLGLSTSYSIIKEHCGAITVDSNVGKGTTLSIYLPATEKEIPEEETVDETTFVGKAKVLVMDDEEKIRSLEKQILAGSGYEVYTAKDGIEAVELYKEAIDSGKPFDVAILDLTVRGGAGGAVAIEEIKKDDPSVKAIVSTGYNTGEFANEYDKHGFAGYLAKPFKATELLAAVYDAIYKP
jgi:two-component system cell cycle sensor histidine kinase/response regulator CckA